METSPVRKQLRKALIWAGVSLLAVMAIGMLTRSHFVVELFTVPIVLMTIAGTAVILGADGFRAASAVSSAREKAGAICLLPLFACLFVLLASPAVSLGQMMMNRIKFEWHARDYAAVVAGGIPDRSTIVMRDRIDRHTLLYFREQAIADNSNGVVYDPTDTVLAAGEGASSTVRGLFGGDLIACRRIRGHYHHCSFT